MGLDKVFHVEPSRAGAWQVREDTQGFIAECHSFDGALAFARQSAAHWHHFQIVIHIAENAPPLVALDDVLDKTDGDPR